MSIYETPNPSKQDSNPDIGILDSHARINLINILHLQLFLSFSNGILPSSQGLMMIQHLWTWTIWVYAVSLEIATFVGKRGIGLPNAGYRPSSHS